MVTIINYKERRKEDGTSFYVLEVQSGIQMVKSQTTGQFYATAKKAFIGSTFNEITCKALIGTEMQGSIQKVDCEPYEYVIKDTGEAIMLHHRFVYSQEEFTVNNPVNQSDIDFKADEAISRNAKTLAFA